MTRTRHALLASAAGLLAIGLLSPHPALAIGDFAIFGISMSSGVEIEPRDLLGEWKDESWRRVAWRVSRGGQPGTFLVTRVHKEGSEETYRGVLVHGKNRGDFLDLTPETDAPPDQSAVHLFFKLEMTRVDGLSIGTPRRVRKAFDGHIAKSYHRLQLLPARPSRFRDLLEEDSKALPGGLVEGTGEDLLVIANPAQAADFLAKHGGESGFWKNAKDGATVVQRRLDEDD